MNLEETLTTVREYRDKCSDQGIEIDPHTLAWVEYWLTYASTKTVKKKEGALDKEQRQAALARLAIVFESSWAHAFQDGIKEVADIYYDLWTAVRDAGKILRGRPEIIRCKECWKRSLDNCPFYDITDTIAPDDWFCPAGEKRETLGEV